MADNTPNPAAPAAPVTAAPVSTSATEKALADLKSNITLIESVVAAVKAGGISAATQFLPQVIGAVETAIPDVEAAIPEIKIGYKTTEYWAVVGATVIGIVYFAVTGNDIPVNLTAGITALIGIYIAARTMLKASTTAAAAKVAAAAPAPAAAVKK